jgi:hypothetical protein
LVELVVGGLEKLDHRSAGRCFDHSGGASVDLTFGALLRALAAAYTAVSFLLVNPSRE